MDDYRPPTGTSDDITVVRISERYLDRQARLREELGLTEEEHYTRLIEDIEQRVGPLLEWQKFWAYAAISGRGVEWSQARGTPHHHIVGLPCSICGRGRSLGVY